MEIILFVCAYEETRPQFFDPIIVNILHASGQPVHIKWTSKNRDATTAYACGVANVSPEQLTAIEADNRCHIIRLSARQNRFNALPPAARSYINTLFAEEGLVAPSNNESLTDVYDRLVQHFGPQKTLAYLEQRVGG